MNITLKGLKSLELAEMVFVVAMMKKYGDLKIEDLQIQNTPNNNKNNNKNNNRNKKKIKPPPKIVKSHDNCTEPCLYDFDCPKWEKCADDKFLQYRLIMNKCEKQ